MISINSNYSVKSTNRSIWNKFVGEILCNDSELSIGNWVTVVDPYPEYSSDTRIMMVSTKVPDLSSSSEIIYKINLSKDSVKFDSVELSKSEIETLVDYGWIIDEIL